MFFREKTTGEYPVLWGDLIERSNLDEAVKIANRHEINLDLLIDLNADVVEKSTPPHNAPWQMVIETKPIQTDSGWIQGWQVNDIPDADREASLKSAKAMLARQLASIRYAMEVGGVNVSGITVRTDRESQAQVSSAYSSLKNGLIGSTQFKGADGWATVTLAEMEPIARAVAEHVAKCFDFERRELARIDAWDGLSKFSFEDLP